MTDEKIEQIVRHLIEVQLDEDNRNAVLEWLEKRLLFYEAATRLGLT
jgi:hypothetical protein